MMINEHEMRVELSINSEMQMLMKSSLISEG